MPSEELTTLLECIDILEREEDRHLALSSFLETVAGFYQADGAHVRLNGVAEQSSFCRGWSASRSCSGSPPRKPVVESASARLSVTVPFCYGIGSFLDKLCHADVQVRTTPALSAPDERCSLEVDNPRLHAKDASFLRCAAWLLLSVLEKRHIKIRLERFIFIDQLTQLANRNQYITFLQDTQQHELTQLGLVYLDMDSLKSINDLYGHAYGDRLLVQTANVLRNVFPKQRIFRTGGDEFVVVCTELSQKDFFSAVNQMAKAFTQPPACHVSHGAFWKEGSADVKNEIRYASELMKIEKQSYYRTQEGKKSLHHSSLLKETLESLERREFEVHLQAQVDLKTGELCGAEALIRKRGVDHRLVLPLDFIPLLESELLIRHVDFFVFHEVCETVSRWLQKGIQPFPVSVNLSRITLMERDIAQKLAEVCSMHGVPPNLIDIEVTESVGKMDLDALFCVTEALRGYGFTLSLDDFGSKYSNLAILTKLNFNSLKIDKSIIDALENSRKAQVLIQHCVEICRELNDVCSVAEGIEKQAQLEFLKSAGCQRGQGYYFSRPLPVSEFESRYLPLSVPSDISSPC